MRPNGESQVPGENKIGAQEAADRIRILREELATGQVQAVLALTPDQRARFDEWSRTALAALAQQFDVDTTSSQKRVSWGMRIASTLGGLAICAAVVLFFMRYWGFLSTPVQLAIAMMTPLAALAGAEFAARRERTRYFTGLLSLVAAASFIMNLAVIGSVFNIVSTERALLAWGAFAIVLAYRYGLRLMLVLGLALLISYAAAAYTAQMGYHWLEFYDRPEHFLLLGLLVFALPYRLKHTRNADFPAVYRLVGALTVFVAILSLAEWGVPSYLPWDQNTIEQLYEFAGLILSAGAIWLGILRGWNGMVNTGATFFTIFLFSRLYHWWWDSMPKYLFFAIIGALGIALVLTFQRLRGKMIHREMGAPA
jgi:uncharacterized membrane protein